MYSNVATAAVAGGIPAAAVAAGFTPLHIAVAVGGSAASVVGLVALLRVGHGAGRASKKH